MVLQFAAHAACAGQRVFAEHHLEGGHVQRERAQVKQLVVQRAQRESVGFNIGAAHVVPLDLYGVLFRTVRVTWHF